MAVDLKTFMDDVCIVIAGKRNKWKSTEEHMVYLQSYARLVRHGNDLLRERSAQIQYENMQAEIAAFVQTCKEDGIDLQKVV